MVCGRISSAEPPDGRLRLMLDSVVPLKPEQPLRMATPASYGCTLFESGGERPPAGG